MALLFEVAHYKIITSALLPMVRIRLRVTNETGKQFSAGMIVCDVYLGKSKSQIADLPYLTTSVSTSNVWVSSGNSFEVQLNIAFSQEILYRLDKIIESQDDVRLNLHPHVQIFYLDQQGKIEQTASDTGICNFEIKMSDWAKIAYDWGKDMVLVPMSPETHETIKELLKTNKHLKNIDELMKELMEIHSNQS